MIFSTRLDRVEEAIIPVSTQLNWISKSLWKFNQKKENLIFISFSYFGNNVCWRRFVCDWRKRRKSLKIDWINIQQKMFVFGLNSFEEREIFFGKANLTNLRKKSFNMLVTFCCQQKISWADSFWKFWKKNFNKFCFRQRKKNLSHYGNTFLREFNFVHVVQFVELFLFSNRIIAFTDTFDAEKANIECCNMYQGHTECNVLSQPQLCSNIFSAFIDWF